MSPMRGTPGMAATIPKGTPRMARTVPTQPALSTDRAEHSGDPAIPLFGPAKAY